MELSTYFELVFTDYTLRTISLGTLLLGTLCGMLGSFAVLRKESLLGDAISHAALPGIAIAFLISETKDHSILLIGALISGLIGSLWIRSMTRNRILKTDTALGIVLSTFFGFGMLLLTYIQKLPNANQSGLEHYLFGQAATLLEKEVWLMAGICFCFLIILALFWKEFKITLFDQAYAQTLGFPTRKIDLLISSFIVVSIIIGLQTVGVVLMSALLLAPAAAARQWTNHFFKMIVIAGVFGGLSGVIGTGISASHHNLSTGPIIVLIASVFVAISFVFAPNRGLLFKAIRFRKNRNHIKVHKTLQLMLELAQNHNDLKHPHSTKILNNFRGFSKNSLQQLVDDQMIVLDQEYWNLTDLGIDTAQNLYNPHQSTKTNE